jgi:hypothetical protein
MLPKFALKLRYYFCDIIHQRLAFSMIPKQQIGEHKVNYQEKKNFKNLSSSPSIPREGYFHNTKHITSLYNRRN